MEPSYNRLSACIAYIPVVGWLYVLFFQRRDPFAMFHLRQSIGLILFLGVVFLGWMVVGWLVAWIPFGMLVAVALFTLVMLAFGVGLYAWIAGILYALRGRVAFLPIFGRFANRLQI
jgi:uncharacterized membrane protein